MTEPTHSDEVLRLVRLAQEKKFEVLETEWIVAVESDAFGLDGLALVLQTVAEQGAKKPLDSLLWMLLEAWTERKGPGDALVAAVRAADFAPDSKVLREELANLVIRARAEVAGIATLVAMTLRRPDLPLRVGISRLERLISLPAGTFVTDSRRRSPGRVMGVDEARKVLTVSFGDSERAYDGVSIENLDRGDQDDFRSLVMFDKDRLKRLAEDAPAELARIVLKAFGPHMSFRELKAALADVVPGAAWTKWWAGAKVLVRRSPMIEMSEGAQPSFFLRARPMAFADRAKDSFDEIADVQDRCAAVLGHLKEAGHDPAAEAAMLRHFAEVLAKPLAALAHKDRASALASRAVLALIRERQADAAVPADPTVAALVTDTDVAALVGDLRDQALAEVTLAHVRAELPETWPEVFAAAIPGASPDVCEFLAVQLESAAQDARLAAVVADVMRRPEQCPSALFWFWKAATSDRFPAGLAETDRVLLTIRMLRAADALARRAQDDKALRPQVSQIRAAIGAREGAALRSVLDKADDVQAKDIRAAIERNAVLTDTARVRALDVVRKTHPAHFAVKLLAPWEDETILWTTAAALHHQEEAYGELVTKKMLENQRAIAAAAEHGDITENAEFTAALEERERLAERATSLQADISKARTITGSMALSDTVNVGSRVRARNLTTGQEETLVFLGPWDTDINKHIYNYRAPLSLAFMGKRVGDVVVFKTETDERRWEILEMGSGL